MNLSDEDSSSDESSLPSKRVRTDTYGASSTTSHGSGILESDDDSSATPYTEEVRPNKINPNYSETNLEGTQRLSRSSLSENCSSPNDQYDDYHTKYTKFKDDTDDTVGVESHISMAKDNAFYNRKPEDIKEDEVAYTSQYSEVSKRMMSNMGHKPGKGLGKFEHGRVEPVKASTQKGRLGLGNFSVLGDAPKDFKWAADDSTPEARKKVYYFPESNEEPPTSDILEKWLQKGQKKLTIEDETNFVDPQVLHGVLSAKSRFDSLHDEHVRQARFRSNPYETIGSVIFLNRAAVKMANIDAEFDFMFTKPKQRNGEMAVGDKDLLYFADVCAGPGGFSEYILYRRGWRAKGFGFTLKGSHDFKLSDFHAGSPETFHTYYGVKDDGDIFDPENLKSLKNYIFEQTDDIGVHFLMADGGFSVEGQENIQEILSKQLYLCQCLAALMVVRTGGSFVVKLFDLFTPFSVSLVYIMYKCFYKVCIYKPVTSRPANSERYLLCFWKKPGTESVENHLFTVNKILWNNRNQKNVDVTSLVPLSLLKEDSGFFEYIFKSNCSIGDKQIKSLLKIAEYTKSEDLKEKSQAEMKKQCLKRWHLPDEVRTQTKFLNANDTLTKIGSLMTNPPAEARSAFSFKNSLLNKQPHYIEKKDEIDAFKNIYDWRFTFLSSAKGSADLRIFLGCGRKKVYQLDGTSWISVMDLQLTLPANTLLYGEIVKELLGEGPGQKHCKALHVIDAVMLGGVDISNESLSERINQCSLFCIALEKGDNNQSGKNLPIRPKRFWNMETFPSAVSNLEYRIMKPNRRALTINVPKRSYNNNLFFCVGSLLFIKETKEPWMAHMSKKQNRKYYYKQESNNSFRSEFILPSEAQLDALAAYASRIMWPWGEAANAIFNGETSTLISRLDMEEYTNKKSV